MLQEETPVRPYELRAQAPKALLQRLYQDVSGLAADEVELAKVEFRERGAAALTAVRGFIFSTACVLVAMASLAACVIAALAYVMPLAIAALIAGAAYLAVALAAAAWSRKRFADAGEPLRSTIGALLAPPTGKSTEAELRSRIERTRGHLDDTLSALEHKTSWSPQCGTRRSA